MKPVNNLDSLLRSLVLKTEGEIVSVRDLLNAVGRRSYGPILLLLGFIAISPLTIVPGANWLVALLTLIIAVQILFGRPWPWIPRKAQDVSFPRNTLVRGVAISEKYARYIDRFLAPRLTFLTEPPFVQLVALVCIAAALITFPLGLIPFGPILPGLTILLFGLGLTARDGFVLIFASATLACAVWLAWRYLPTLLSYIT